MSTTETAILIVVVLVGVGAFAGAVVSAFNLGRIVGNREARGVVPVSDNRIDWL